MDSHIDIQNKTQTEVLKLINNVQQPFDSEKKYHDTLDNLLEGLQIIGFDWRYIYANNTVVQQSKFSREELLGYTMMEKYPGIENTEMFDSLRVCMNTRVAKYFENEFRYPDGTSGWFELSIQPTEAGIIILSNDISERKRAEKEKLEHAKGLEAIIFMTSHNLRQPIVHLQGLVNILKTCKNSPEEFDKILDHLDKSAASVDTYTREITSYVQAMEIKTQHQDDKN